MTRAAVLLLIVGMTTLITAATLWFGRPALIAGLAAVGCLSLAAATLLLLGEAEPVAPARERDEL